MMLDRINEPAVTPEILGEAMQAIAELPEDDRRDMTATMIAIFRFVDDLKDVDKEGLSLAIYWRLAALARLTADGALRGFARPGLAGAEWLHEDVIRCAAELPVIEVGDDITFDEAAFQARLLAIASPEGSA